MSDYIETYIEIPVRVYYSKQKYIPTTRHYPGQPAAIVVEAIEIDKDPEIPAERFIENYAFEHYLDSLTEICEEEAI